MSRPLPAVATTALAPRLPALIESAGPRARSRFVEFFVAEIRNPNTRKAYARAVGRFATWADQHGFQLEQLTPVHVAAYIEQLGRELEAASVKQHLAALRMLGDYLVTGGVLTTNPAASVRGPRLVVRTGKTPALSAEEARELLDSIETGTRKGLRDRALLGVMLFGFARVSAAVGLRVRDYEHRSRRAWLALHEKGGQWRRVPVHTTAAEMLDAWLDASGLADSPEAPLFQGFEGRTDTLTGQPLSPGGALYVVKARARTAGLPDRLCNHSCRATGITAFLAGGGTLEAAAQLAGHASTRTTQLYDRRPDLYAAEDIERIRI